MSKSRRDRRDETKCRLVALLALVLACLVPARVHATSISPKDLQVLGRALAFLAPPLTGDGVIAIAYAAGNSESRKDAEATAARIGEGLRVGGALLRPKVVDTEAIATTEFNVVIAMAGAEGQMLSDAARNAHALCVTTDLATVQAGLCAMAISAEPRVEIVVNHAVLAAAGIGFAAAFRMMIREI